MALAKTIDFEGGVPGNAPVVGGDIVEVTAPIVYTADSFLGSVALSSTGGRIAVNWQEQYGFSIFAKAPSSPIVGASRIWTIMTTGGVFHGMFRFHPTGNVFDIADGSSTRVGAASATTWSANQWFRFDGQVSGTGLSHSMSVRIFADPWASVATETLTRTVTGASGTVGRFRTGAQGITSGSIVVDHIRLYDTVEWADPVLRKLVSGAIIIDLGQLAAASKSAPAAGLITTSVSASDDAAKEGKSSGAAGTAVNVSALDVKVGGSSGSAVALLSMQAVAASSRAGAGPLGVSAGLSGVADKVAAGAGALGTALGMSGTAVGESEVDTRPAAGGLSFGFGLSATDFRVSPVTGLIEVGPNLAANATKQAISAGVLSLVLEIAAADASPAFVVRRGGVDVPARVGGVVRRGSLVEVSDWQVT